MKFDEGKILLLLSGILLGIVITSFIVDTSISPTTFLTYQQYEKMSRETNELNSEIRGLYKEESELAKKLRKYEGKGENSKNVIDTLNNELKEIKLFYGYTEVSGPGIRITINDRHENIYENPDVMFDITHNWDLLYLVNDLKNAGAEAISINGKRIVGDTSITCEGLVIMVNGEYIVPPFEVLAIGDPEALTYSLNLPESHYKDMESRKLYLKVERLDKIKIDPINNLNQIKYAKDVNK